MIKIYDKKDKITVSKNNAIKNFYVFPFKKFCYCFLFFTEYCSHRCGLATSVFLHNIREIPS